MAGDKFKAGDLVQLKAGGPKMVVEKFINFADEYQCSWFSGAKHNSQRFSEEALMLFQESDE